MPDHRRRPQDPAVQMFWTVFQKTFCFCGRIKDTSFSVIFRLPFSRLLRLRPEDQVPAGDFQETLLPFPLPDFCQKTPYAVLKGSRHARKGKILSRRQHHRSFQLFQPEPVLFLSFPSFKSVSVHPAFSPCFLLHPAYSTYWVGSFTGRYSIRNPPSAVRTPSAPSNTGFRFFAAAQKSSQSPFSRRLPQMHR